MSQALYALAQQRCGGHPVVRLLSGPVPSLSEVVRVFAATSIARHQLVEDVDVQRELQTTATAVLADVCAPVQRWRRVHRQQRLRYHRRHEDGTDDRVDPQLAVSGLGQVLSVPRHRTVPLWEWAYGSEDHHLVVQGICAFVSARLESGEAFLALSFEFNGTGGKKTSYVKSSNSSN